MCARTKLVCFFVDSYSTTWQTSLSEDEYGRRPSDQEALFTKFQSFLTRASTCQSIFVNADPSASFSSQSSSFKSTPSSSKPQPRRQIILLEDLPNILHSKTQDQFHAALQALVESSPSTTVPVVIIVSDAGTRGEARDQALGSGVSGWNSKDIVDIRSVLPSSLLNSAFVHQIGYVLLFSLLTCQSTGSACRFNPIAPTLLRKALQALLAHHFSSPSSSSRQPSKDMLDIVVESANGDIRSAIMALQFACIVELPKGKRKNVKGGDAKMVLEAITRRESSLALFHLMGKVMYNKRELSHQQLTVVCNVHCVFFRQRRPP